MTRQSEKIRYSSWNFIQDIIGFIFIYLSSFPDLGQDHTVETYVDHIQPDEPQNIKHNLMVPVHTPTPFKVTKIYKPLILSPRLHGFLENYHKYLPKFDGEYGSITAEKHIQGFEIFLTFLRLKKMMSVSRLFLHLCKVKLKSGSKTYQLQALVISISL
jgi:hypothetical protein